LHFKANIAIGRLRTDPNNSRRKYVDFNKGRTITKWYRANNIGEALSLVAKTRFAKYLCITNITYDEYLKGVEKHHEY